MILVTGATGQTGSHVVRSLLARGAAVRVFVRDADRARTLFGDAVDVAPGDFAYPPSLRAALAGADALFLSGADDPRRVEWETDAIDAARRRRRPAHRAPVRAPGGARRARGVLGLARPDRRAPAPLRRPATVLGAGFYASNLLAAADGVAFDGRLYAPAGDARIAMIDPATSATPPRPC